MKEGVLLRNYLKINKISILDISKKFGISRAAVYAYFTSMTLTDIVKEKFIEHYNIDFEALLEDPNLVEDPPIEYKSALILELERQIQMKDETIESLTKTLSSLAQQLERLMK